MLARRVNPWGGPRPYVRGLDEAEKIWFAANRRLGKRSDAMQPAVPTRTHDLEPKYGPI